MPRDHARFYTSIWAPGSDFRALDQAGQHAYMTLCSQERLSYAGVLDYFPGRLSELTAGVTEKHVEAAVKRLERARYVVVDRRTAELLVRSYVRHDGVFDRTNMGKAVGTAVNRIVSTRIRDAVLREIARHMRDRPDLAGFIGFKETCPIGYEIASGMESDIELPMES
jgi:hypothetical protein